ERLLRREPRGVGWVALAGLPEGAPPRVGIEEIEAAHRRPEEGVVDDRDECDPTGPPQLAVLDGLDPRALLEGDRLEDSAILCRAQLVGIDRARARALPCFAQVLGSQQTADDVRTHHRRHGRHPGLLWAPVTLGAEPIRPRKR